MRRWISCVRPVCPAFASRRLRKALRAGPFDVLHLHTAHAHSVGLRAARFLGERFTRLADLRGLSASRPGLAAALSLFMLSLGGIPATGGFLGKWFVFSVLVDARELMAPGGAAVDVQDLERRVGLRNNLALAHAILGFSDMQVRVRRH